MIYLNLLIIILIIIFIHEFGHYIIARYFKVHVSVFSLGFGKSIYNFIDKNNTNWKISMIPLGGYVKIKGFETIFQNKKDSDYDSDSFQSLNLFKKILILLGGSFFNIITAWICLFCILFFFGITSFSPEVGNVLDNSPASINDIREGDVIIRINETNINKFSDIGEAIHNSKTIHIELIRDHNLISKVLDLTYNNEIGKFMIGISSTNTPIINKFAIIKSLKQSFLFIPNYYLETMRYLTRSYKNNTLSQEIAGPIGIVKMADQLMLDKLRGVLFIFIMISLFVGIFNLLPIPLLDGGHIIFFSLRSFFSNSLPPFVTKIYLAIGITIIFFLFIIVTFNDIFYK